MKLIYANLNRSWQNKTLHSYTTFGASSLEFLLFGLIWWRILANLQNNQKWKSPLIGCVISCLAVALLALILLMTGRELPWTRSLLLEVSKNGSPSERATLMKDRSFYCSLLRSFRCVAVTWR